jgi:hypothetical protein
VQPRGVGNTYFGANLTAHPPPTPPVISPESSHRQVPSRAQETRTAYLKITNITPDIDAKFLLVISFDYCLRIFFCLHINIMAVDNTLSSKRSLVCVQHSAGERRFRQYNLWETTNFNAIVWASPWAQCPTLLHMTGVQLLLMHDLPNGGVRCMRDVPNSTCADWWCESNNIQDCSLYFGLRTVLPRPQICLLSSENSPS